jgi:hypothetical protein
MSQDPKTLTHEELVAALKKADERADKEKQRADKEKEQAAKEKVRADNAEMLLYVLEAWAGLELIWERMVFQLTSRYAKCAHSV